MEAPFERFGCMVFDDEAMQERLPSPVYKQWKKTVADEGTLDRPTADAIAHAMKRWAMERGCTHYTHWFQPMNGATAEKHESFVEPDKNGKPFAHFSGKNLIMGEPDASSFPSGGLRSTYEARGYTYWDISCPVFIVDNVLHIPTIFVSYSGDSIDKKAPVLKSIRVLNKAATRIVNLLGDKDVKYVYPVCGLEQEYFLIDRKYFDLRDDLRFTGRTLFGARAPKGQELEDHYQASIPTRVASFMKDINKQLWELGIYAKTEHNETAPAQFELACVYGPTAVAIDQNHVVMDVLKRTAEKYDLVCLLHEKPFAGINGSGKHTNYSLTTSTGQNLFAPGDKPAENIRFLLFICAFVKAVDTFPDLLRMSASCVGNDHRLGASEAPPAIISIFLGTYIEDILMDMISTKTKKKKAGEAADFTPIHGLSYVPHDNTDRNRTSPVAFTGNKFEFRMTGSSMSGAMPNCILNSIFAWSLDEIAAELDGIKYLQDVRAKALEICKDIIRKHKRILFTGDGYSEDWVKEAEKRGLPNIRSYIESVEVLAKPEIVKMLTELGIYNERELRARYEVFAEQYPSTIGIEVRTLLGMIRKDILPAMCDELTLLAETEKAAGKAAPAYVKDHLKLVSKQCDDLYALSEKLDHDFTEVMKIKDHIECGKKIYYEIMPLAGEIRAVIDAYEEIASAANYPYPTYADMLFKL
ncbi:MAG: glutamine synthetase III [Solobacterium sp.]|nr:glutamine synthetase III [Solobacterium sp.]MBQ6531726.1 glutamine synthetase III [Solobacterium sp.]